MWQTYSTSKVLKGMMYLLHLVKTFPQVLIEICFHSGHDALKLDSLIQQLSVILQVNKDIEAQKLLMWYFHYVLKYQWFDIWMGFSCFVYHIKEISCMKWCCQSDGCVRSDSHLSKSQCCSFCLYKHPDNPKMRATLTVQSTQNKIC